MEQNIRLWLSQVFYYIGMDEPSNMDKIVDYMIDDIGDAADPENYNNSDLAIAFRRYIERDDEK